MDVAARSSGARRAGGAPSSPGAYRHRRREVGTPAARHQRLRPPARCSRPTTSRTPGSTPLPLDPSSAAVREHHRRQRHDARRLRLGPWNGGPIGIPYVVVNAGQPPRRRPVQRAAGERPGAVSDPAQRAGRGWAVGGGDRHVLVVDNGSLPALRAVRRLPERRRDLAGLLGRGASTCGPNALRPDTWTSADAAGFPILPGLVRYDEVASGPDPPRHPLHRPADPRRPRLAGHPRRVVAHRRGQYPPMGQRFRLNAGLRRRGASRPQVQVILQAMKTYGIVLADNGSSVVHQRRARRALEQRRAPRARPGAGLGIRGGGRQRPAGGRRAPARPASRSAPSGRQGR